MFKKIKIQPLYVGVVGLLCAFGFLVWRNVNLEQRLSDALKKSSQSGDEIGQLVKDVSTHIKLPAGETPSVATVTDVEKVKEQPFFAQSQNGDKVLIYSVSKKAYLYRPSEKKLVDVAPINIPENTSGTQPVVAQGTPAPSAAVAGAATSATPSAQLRVGLYNGTTTVGLTGNIENYLKSKDQSFVFPIKENAQKKTYDTTTVVDVRGQNGARAEALAQLLQGSVGLLPEGETASENVDLVVILGPPSVNLK